MKPRFPGSLFVLILAAGALGIPGAEPPALGVRASNFLVTPSTGPVTHIQIKNGQTAALSGTIAVAFPEGWRVEPGSRDFSLAGGETRALPFTIKQGRDRADNRYPVTVKWTADGQSGETKQEVACASAPYLKPKINGDLADWRDAIPITLSTGGLKTVLRTCWNSAEFCVAVEVEEARLVPRREGKPCDAIQFALLPENSASLRHEFMIAQSAGLFAHPRCYELKQGDPAMASAEQARAAVRRKGKITAYEAAIPWSLVPEIRADAGRAFHFSLLVHDPDGTGLRDFGEALNRWPEDRQKNWWRSWPGAQWGETPPYDGLSIFGFCSSIH